VVPVQSWWGLLPSCYAINLPTREIDNKTQEINMLYNSIPPGNASTVQKIRRGKVTFGGELP
jgi:hypothetical protein